MRIAIIGRGEWLYESALRLQREGYELPLIVTAKGAPEYKVQHTDFKNLADQCGSVYLYDPRISAESISAALNQAGPIDIAVSINYSGVISQDVIECFRLGILNAHGGDLPRYRGNACQAWAIINGEDRVGLCIHKMIGGELDSGDIIARDYFPLTINTRIAEVYEWFDIKIPDLITQSVAKLRDKPGFVLEKQSTAKSDALRCYPRLPEDGRIDWSKSNTSILRLVNASSEPYSGAFGYLEDKLIRIWRAGVVEDGEVFVGIPGQVAFIDKSGGSIGVITGKDKLLVAEIEYEGFRGAPATVIKSLRTRLK